MATRKWLLPPSAGFSRRDFSRHMFCGLGLAVFGSRVQASEQTARRHRFLCCDYQSNKVAIIAADGSVEWEYAAETPQDCWLMPNGNVLFCYRAGVKEISREKKVIMEYQAPSAAQCHSCQPIADGRAESGFAELHTT